MVPIEKYINRYVHNIVETMCVISMHICLPIFITNVVISNVLKQCDQQAKFLSVNHVPWG